MATPEGRVKREVKKVLMEFGDRVDGFWPVPTGYGESHLDWVGCIDGHFIAIETKAPGESPTPRQQERIRRVRAAGGTALVIDGTKDTTTYDELRRQINYLLGAYDD